MKLTKDTLIEGKIIKEGTDIRILEATIRPSTNPQKDKKSIETLYLANTKMGRGTNPSKERDLKKMKDLILRIHAFYEESYADRPFTVHDIEGKREFISRLENAQGIDIQDLVGEYYTKNIRY